MVAWIICMIYVGGVVADWDKKRGFLDRVGWPVILGAKLYCWSIK